MKTTEILSELISYIEEYSDNKTQKELNTKDFILWINSKLFKKVEAEKASQHNIEMELVFSMMLISKQFKAIIKNILSDSEISTPDGYSFLLHLSFTESMRKMELVNIHLLEAPSGIEIIKRLLKKGLIEEFDDSDDRRAKRLKITKLGEKEVQLFQPKMEDAYQRMVEKLNLNQKVQLLSIVSSLR